MTALRDPQPRDQPFPPPAQTAPASGSDSPLAPPGPEPAGTRAWFTPAALIAVVIWGSTFPIAKYALEEFPVLAYAAIRPILAAGLAFALLRARGEPVGIERRDWSRLMIAGIGGQFIFQACFIIGLGRTSSSHSALIASAAPPMLAALVFWAVQGDHPNGRSLIGLAFGVAGVALVVGNPGGNGASLDGDLISVVAALAWVAVTTLPAPLVRRYGALRITAWLILISGVAFLPLSAPALSDTVRHPPSWLAWGSLVYTSLLGMITANTLWQHAVGKVGPRGVLPYLYLQPAVALLAALLLLGERVGPLQLAGGLLAMVGVGLVRR